MAWKISQSKLYILNAWDTTENQFLGQLTIDCKTKEITIAPKLLRSLNLKRAIMSVDALMTQTVIDQKDVDREVVLKAAIGSENQAMIVYDVNIPGLSKNLRTVSLLSFQGGLIFNIELVYDTRCSTEKQKNYRPLIEPQTDKFVVCCLISYLPFPS